MILISEVKTMSSIQFPNTQQPYQVNDARIPADPGAYQQMVTDAEGNWGVADRLAYKAEEKTVLWEGNITTVESQSTAGVYITASAIEADGYNLLGYDSENPNQNLYCEFNGVEIQLPYAGWSGMTSMWGNRYLTSPASYEDDGSNVCVEQYTTGSISMLTFYTREPGSCSIKLYNKVEITHPIPAEYIPRIVLTYDGTNYTCNVPFEEFEVAVMSGLPMSYVETHNKKSTTAVTALFSTDINGWIVQANDLYDEAVKRLMVTEDSVGEYEA